MSVSPFLLLHDGDAPLDELLTVHNGSHATIIGVVLFAFKLFCGVLATKEQTHQMIVKQFTDTLDKFKTDSDLQIRAFVAQSQERDDARDRRIDNMQRDTTASIDKLTDAVAKLHIVVTEMKKT